MAGNVYLFTAEFPFASKESFLEDEVFYLADVFETVNIIPLSGGGTSLRKTPLNCNVIQVLNCKGRNLKILYGLFGIYRVFPLYMKEFFKKKVYKNVTMFKSWFSNMLICSYYLHFKYIRNIIRNLNDSDVVYFYWGVVYNTLAPYMKGKAKLISRFHGEWDLWNRNGDEGYKPMREALLNSLDCAIFISLKGECFFNRIHPTVRTKTFRLGSRDSGIAQKSDDGVLRVVSCSTVYPLKRVPLIYESLKNVGDRLIEWTHIGGGPDFEELKQLTDNPPHNMKVILTGSLTLDEVLNYYRTHRVDVFVNLSTNEGIPVSIMEAISLNIPIVATDVGGNSEIVTSQTGILVSSNPIASEVAKAVIAVSDEINFTPREFWKKYYSAEVNYAAFADFLVNQL